ncbi:fibronectin type III/BRCA1 domain-containing protein [Amanita rubescens]|nr:fibronectin type III/BRCA1 domain-containing protein [Amanita rubescens]
MSAQKNPSPESFTFTILLGERAHLIEFPSILLPPGATTGSIVNIAVHQNHAEEKKRDTEFWTLQDDILKEFGQETPVPPKLNLRHVTQTSVTLDYALWTFIEMANDWPLYPLLRRTTSTKLSGLDLNTEYTFQLILRTTAGTYPSNLIRVKTHSMTDTSGISVCFGNIQDPVLLENARMALQEMNGKWSDKIQIDTTHFVCTTPAAVPSAAQAAGNVPTTPGVEYQRALQLSIPVVQPHWILACHSEKNPMSQASLPRSPNSATSPSPRGIGNRASMPAPSRTSAHSPPYPGKSPSSPESRTRSSRFEPTMEEDGEIDVLPERDADIKRMSRGEMNKDFKFPVARTAPSSPPEPPHGKKSAPRGLDSTKLAQPASAKPIITPSSIEVPPPPPVEKERSQSSVEDGDEVGDTVDIPL